MKRRVLSCLLALVLALGLLPVTALADSGETTGENATPVYVSSIGNDESGKGSVDEPYATLAKAVDVAADGATIYVMSDLTMTECARFYSKSLTITSDENGPYTVKRGTPFKTQSDDARSWYNPAMIEVQTTDSAASLTLTNIILDDDGKHEGTVFAQAVSDDGTGLDCTENTNCVQDAILASNATVPSTITLGDGAVLCNFGGMSAVRVTSEAKLVMESGSVIEDTAFSGRATTKPDTKNGEVGPAGAVWLQGGSFEMKAGAAIQNINGRAVYADGGEVAVGGTISGITGNSNMWQKNNGSAIHLRNTGANATLTSTGVIENISGGGSAVYVTGKGNKITTDQGSTIGSLTNTTGIYCAFDSNAQLSGEITGLSSGVALSLNDGATADLKKDGSIHDNACATAVVYLRGGAEFTIRGKINGNHSTGNCAALYIVTNGSDSHATLEEGGEICNNANGGKKYGAAVEVQQGNCSFTMNGGKITGNSGPLGAIQIHKDSARFIMNGGEVTGNTSTGSNITEAGIYVENGTPRVELNAGKAQSITLAANVSAQTVKGNIYIADVFALESGSVSMIQDSKTVAPADGSLDIKLGNASEESVAALTAASVANGWNRTPLATFWTQRDGAAELTISGLTLNDTLPQIVYALVQETNANGQPVTGAEIKVYSTVITSDGIFLTHPNGYENGCAVALVQPTTDFGSVVIAGPAEIAKSYDAVTYEVPYTATYTMSDSLLNMLKNASSGVPMTFVVELDSRLAAKEDDNGNFLYNFNGDSILNVDESQITVSEDGHTITVVCNPVTDWATAISGKTSVKMTLTGTGVLAAADFAAGDYLNTTGHIEGTIPSVTAVMIPANVSRTKMVAPTPTYNVTYDANGGSGTMTDINSPYNYGVEATVLKNGFTRSGYTFTGWNTQANGKGTPYKAGDAIVVTRNITLYAQWSKNSSGRDDRDSYYFAVEKIDAQDNHALNGATFELYQYDSKGKTVNRTTAKTSRNGSESGIALFSVDSITGNGGDWYYVEVTAPEGYVLDTTEHKITKNDFSTSRSTAIRNAETVRNYRSSTPNVLNGDDHYAYVVGYSDGTVRPNANISRAEVATIFFRLLKDSVRDGSLLTSNTYTDVPDSYWANTAISTMTGLGYVQGRSTTTFDPQSPITRAEFATICARFDTGTSSGTQTFSDISGHWAEKYIQRAAELGWIKGFEDGTFRPDTYITRAQAMTMINRMLNRIPEEESDLLTGMNVWTDCSPGDWFYLAVQEATNSHDFKHKAGNYETWTKLTKNPDWTRYEN